MPRFVWDNESEAERTWTLVDKYGQFAIQRYGLFRNKKGKTFAYTYEGT